MEKIHIRVWQYFILSYNSGTDIRGWVWHSIRQCHLILSHPCAAPSFPRRAVCFSRANQNKHAFLGTSTQNFNGNFFIYINRYRCVFGCIFFLRPVPGPAPIFQLFVYKIVRRVPRRIRITFFSRHTDAVSFSSLCRAIYHKFYSYMRNSNSTVVLFLSRSQRWQASEGF